MAWWFRDNDGQLRLAENIRSLREWHWCRHRKSSTEDHHVTISSTWHSPREWFLTRHERIITSVDRNSDLSFWCFWTISLDWNSKKAGSLNLRASEKALMLLWERHFKRRCSWVGVYSSRKSKSRGITHVVVLVLVDLPEFLSSILGIILSPSSY